MWKQQRTPLLDSEDYCTQVVIHPHPTGNGRALANATRSHIGLHLTDNCIWPLFFQLSSICLLCWTGWLSAPQQNIHCVLLHPLPQNCSAPEAWRCFLKACHWEGADKIGGGVQEDVWPVSNGSNLKKHGFNTFGTSKEGLSAYIKKKKKKAAPFFFHYIVWPKSLWNQN